MSDTTAAAICIGIAIAGLLWIIFKHPSYPDVEPAPRPKPKPRMCDCCRTHRARTVAATHTDELRYVCFGCLDNGFVRGWWLL